MAPAEHRQGGTFQIEVVFATPDHQELIELNVARGSNVRQAIERSGIAQCFSAFNLAELQAGIWGIPVSGDHVLTEGDRVELYRPLLIDPRSARRDLAAQGRSMGKNPQPVTRQKGHRGPRQTSGRNS